MYFKYSCQPQPKLMTISTFKKQLQTQAHTHTNIILCMSPLMSFICHIHNYTEYNEEWNVFSAFNPSKCTHLEQWAADCAAPGEQSWTSCRSRDSNPQPWVTSGFKSNALSIRPTTALVYFLISLSSNPGIVYYKYRWLCDKLLLFPYCKSLWLKVSAKYLNVIVYEIVFSGWIWLHICRINLHSSVLYRLHKNNLSEHSYMWPLSNSCSRVGWHMAYSSAITPQ